MRHLRSTEQASIPAYTEVGKPAFYLFIFYVLFTYLQGGERFPVLGSIRLEFILGALLTPLAFFYVSKWNAIADARKVMNWSIAMLLCMGGMVALSRYPAISWDVYWNRGIKFAIFGLCIASFVSSPRALGWFLFAFLFSFFRMGFEGFLGTIDGSLIWENQEIPRLHGTTPSYAHPNSFSGTQLGVLPYILYLFPLLPWYWRAALAVQALFVGNVVLRTGSRTGYLGFIAGLMSVVWQSKYRFRAAIGLSLAMLVAVPLIPAEYVGRFDTIFQDTSLPGEDTSIGQRKEILTDAWSVFLEYPFGVGVGAFPLVRAALFGRSQDTHNLYLEVATNLGAQGFVVFCGFIICLWMAFKRLSISTQRQLIILESLDVTDEEDRRHIHDVRLVLACSKATWIFLVIRLVLGGFGMDMYEVYWWYLAGLAVSLSRIDAVARKKTEDVLRRYRARSLSVFPGEA